MARNVTSIRIDEELWKQCKHFAIDSGLTLSELVEKALKKELSKKPLK